MEKVAELSERLEIAIKESSSTTQLAEMIGMSKQAISAYTTGIRSPKRPVINAMANALCVSPLWLMGYDVPKFTESSALIPPGFQPTPELCEVPRVGNIACGEPITAEQNLEGYDKVPSSWHSDFTLVCRGESMQPRIQDGDVVAIHRQPMVENGEIAAVRIGGEATLKHVYLHDNYIELRPENPEYQSIIRARADMNDVKIEGKAVGLCRKL